MSEAEQLKELKDYVWLCVNKDQQYDWIKFNACLRGLKKDGCKLRGILYTIRYMIEYKNMAWDGNLAIVGYYYGEAERYYKWRQGMAKKIAKSHYGVGDTQVIDRQDIKQEECVFD